MGLNDSFGLGMDAVGRLGGHSFRRTHRNAAGGKFPGMMITYALIEALEKIAEATPEKARIITRAKVNEVITDASGRVIGCKYEQKGKTYEEMGPVIVATGGYGAGVLFEGSLVKRIRPELGHLPTTNGKHCTGDGIEFSTAPPEPLSFDELISAVSIADHVSTPPPDKRGNSAAPTEAAAPAAPAESSASSSTGGGMREYTMEEVAKHNTPSDCWVVVNGQVLNATSFLSDHPGGEMAITSFAGRDASEEFNMLHEPTVVEKYAPEIVIGTIKAGSKL